MSRTIEQELELTTAQVIAINRRAEDHADSIVGGRRLFGWLTCYNAYRLGCLDTLKIQQSNPLRSGQGEGEAIA